MCLSIAILCFGVISATSVEYSISGKITYEAPNLDVKVTTKTYGIPWSSTNEGCAVYHLCFSCDELRDEASSVFIGDEWSDLSADDKTTFTEVYRKIFMAQMESTRLVEPDSTDWLNLVCSSEWTPSSTSNETVIPINYGDSETEENKYWIYLTFINVQNLNSEKAVKANLIDTTDVTNGDNRNSLIFQTTDTLNYITTADNQTVTNSDGSKTTSSCRNLVLIYSVKDLYTKVENVSFSYNVKITEDDGESLGNQKTLLSDETNGYYYVNLGTALNGAKKIGRKWRLVSLDGQTRYTYDSSNSPTLQKGKSLFVQETYSESSDSTYFNEGSSNSNYYTSSIRKKVQTGEYLGLTESDISDFIEPVDLGSISYYMGNSSSLSIDTDATPITKDSSDTTKDYFYLMSYEEVNTFLDTKAFTDWYALRNPWSRYKSSESVRTNVMIEIFADGDVYTMQASSSCGIRTMFTLSSSYSG